MRLWLLGAALLTACVGLVWQSSRSAAGGIRLPLHDFAEYWAAGRLLAHGQNPYDPERVGLLESEAGRTAEPVLMWNPPWTLAIVLPLGLAAPAQVPLAQLAWLIVQLAALLYSADALWCFYGGDPRRRWIAWLIAFTLLPSFFALAAGQISPLLLLGAVLFLRCERRGWGAAAGAAAVLLAIKPHLVYLFWIALLPWALQRRRWALLAGGALVGLAATAVPLLFNPHVLGQYWHTLSTRPPEQYRSPTLGFVVRLALGGGPFALQYLALLPGLLWLAVHYRRHRHAWDWAEQLPLLLLVSMLTAAYGAWPFDLVLLLVPVVRGAVLLSHSPRLSSVAAAAAYYLAVNALALVLLARGAEYLWFLWMTPALLLGSVLFAAAARFHTKTASQAQLAPQAQG